MMLALAATNAPVLVGSGLLAKYLWDRKRDRETQEAPTAAEEEIAAADEARSDPAPGA